jgi:hypothetical protein
MALLGRKVSLASILAMLTVLLQCLFHHKTTTGSTTFQHEKRQDDNNIWAKFSALAGIGFAVGSQKLFLNVRHELLHQEDSSKVLAGSLTTYGSAYLVVILLAGSSTYCLHAWIRDSKECAKHKNAPLSSHTVLFVF